MITRDNIQDICKIQRMASDFTQEDFLDTIKSHYPYSVSNTGHFGVIHFNTIIAYVDFAKDCLCGQFICYNNSGEDGEVYEAFETERVIFCY